MLPIRQATRAGGAVARAYVDDIVLSFFSFIDTCKDTALALVVYIP